MPQDRRHAGRTDTGEGRNVLRRDALDAARLEEVLDPRLLKTVMSRLSHAIGATNVATGKTLDPINVSPAMLARIFGSALIVAAGLDLAKTDSPPPPLLWSDGANRLLVHLDEFKVTCGDGFVDVMLIVECDQSKRDSVTSTFVTSSVKRPGGFIWATEDRPRGPAVVVDVWGGPLLALSWRALLEVACLAAESRGTDQFGRGLIPSTALATPDGLLVTPMAAHRFMGTGSARR